MLYREAHVLLDELAEAVVDGKRREFMETLGSVDAPQGESPLSQGNDEARGQKRQPITQIVSRKPPHNRAGDRGFVYRIELLVPDARGMQR